MGRRRRRKNLIQREVVGTDQWETVGSSPNYRRACRQAQFLQLVDRHTRYRVSPDPPIALQFRSEED